MAKAKARYERGETLTYPRIYPTLTFTPVFGHRGDFMWIEEVKAAWPEHDSEFAFVRDTVHDERVDRLKEENERLRVENERLDDATLGAVLRMREATEALDRLVRALADADAENRKLREYAHSLEVANIDVTSRLEDYIGQHDPTDALVVEVKAANERLRELMRDTYDCICEMYAYMDGGYAYEDAEADPAYGPILKRMRELGIEVDNG